MITRFLSVLSLFFCLIGFSSALAAKAENWTLTDGTKIKAEAAGVYGPLAVFDLGRNRGKWVPLRLLKPVDCVRFHQASKELPARSTDWAASKSWVSRDVAGHLFRWNGDELVKEALAGRPEPELFLVFYARNSVGASWEMTGAAGYEYGKIVEDYPGTMEAIFCSDRNNVYQHENMVRSQNMQWLVAGVDTLRKMRSLNRFTKSGVPFMVVLNRHGVPLVSSQAKDGDDEGRAMSQLRALVKAGQPGTKESWYDRVHYYSAVQLGDHLEGEADPMPIGWPWDDQKMRKLGVKRIVCTLEISAEGRIENLRLKKTSEFAKANMKAIGGLLYGIPFVPAVKNGEFVVGEYALDYTIEN